MSRTGEGLAHSPIAAILLLASGALAKQSTPPAVKEEPPATVASPPAAEEPSGGSEEPRKLADLTPLNFFTEGWAEPWVHRHRKTPDMALLRVTTNFLEREFRVDYTLAMANNNAKLVNTQVLQGLIAYGLDRRLMLEVITNYQWLVLPNGAPPASGPGGAGLIRFQLVDTETASYDFQYRISARSVAAATTSTQYTLTSMQYAVAGWHDIGAALSALGRFGLYYSFQWENLLGAKPGALSNDLTYVLSFAETWTRSTMAVIGNLTTFVELAGVTLLDGTNAGTTVSLTPGIRFWFLPKNSFTFGVDIPLTSNPPYSVGYRANYILNF
jgi:hypothetical protein